MCTRMGASQLVASHVFCSAKAFANAGTWSSQEEAFKKQPHCSGDAPPANRNPFVSTLSWPFAAGV